MPSPDKTGGSAAGAYALRDGWATRRATIGAWCSIGDSYSAEVIGRAGFDWVCIDLQHGLVSTSDLLPMIQALSLTMTPSLVRVPWNEPSGIMRVLDLGAQGVVVPLVESAADAARAVDAARYPPVGHRSWGPIRPAQEITGYSPELADRRTLVIVQVETVLAVERLDEILGVPGIDGVMVGPNDLTLSAGGAPTMTPGGRYRELVLEIAQRSRERGVVAGIFCGSVEVALGWLDVGFDMLAVASDAIFMRQAATAAVARMRTAMADAGVGGAPAGVDGGGGEVSQRPPGY
jgi:4-hydroxy-2-oxoheptanedioate aldolase